MKDLIAKLQMDANCALGAIWMHIDAQSARIAELESEVTRLSASWRGDATVADALEEHIAELEAQIAAASAPQKDESTIFKIEDCGHDGKERFRIYDEFGYSVCYAVTREQAENVAQLLSSTPLLADTDKLREAIAGISNNAITEAWESCGGVDGFYKSFGYQQFAHAVLDLAADAIASTALQAPVREVPEGWRLVPEQATEAMYHAGQDVPEPRAFGAVYRAMLAAAPLPAAPIQQEGDRG